MGLTFAEVTFHGKPGRSKRLRLLVDSGATYTVIPARIARTLGARPLETTEFELADGRVVTRTLGQLDVELQGRRVTTIVVFGAPRDGSLLGAYALEGLRLQLDAFRRVLRPMERVSMMAVTARLDMMAVSA